MAKFSSMVISLLLVICVLLSFLAFQQKQYRPLLEPSTVGNSGTLIPMTEQPALKAKALVTDQLASRSYYLDNDRGNNKNNGTAPNKAWKDFTRLKRHLFAPGDKIFLKKNVVWNQTFFTPKGGTKANPIIVDSYGSGQSPIIDLENLHTAGIRVYSSHIIIQNLTLKNAKKTCVDIAVSGGFNNITLNNLTIQNSGKNGIAVFKGGRGLAISHCRIENSKNNGIHLGGSPENRLSQVTVTDCHIRGTTNNDGITIHEDGAGNPAGSFFLLRNNLAEMCAEQGFDITTGTHILLEDNRSSRNMQGGIMVAHSARNVTIKTHVSTDEPCQKTGAAIILAGDHGNIRLMNSVIKGDGYHLLLLKTDNIAVINNTFIWNGGRAPIDITGTIENLNFINNIVYSKQKRMSRIRFLETSRPPNYPGFHFDYNLYYVPENKVVFSHNNKNFEFKALQKKYRVEQHSLNIDPGFTDPEKDDYSLSLNSPAVDSGGAYTPVLSTSENGRQLTVENTTFFFSTPRGDTQCIMLDNRELSFTIEDVDYKKKTLTLDRPIGKVTRQYAGACYVGTGRDIGAFERHQ